MNGTTAQTEAWMRKAGLGFREDVIDEYLDCGDVLDVGVVDSRRGVESTVSRLEQFSTSLHEHIRRRNPRSVSRDLRQLRYDISVLHEL